MTEISIPEYCNFVGLLRVFLSERIADLQLGMLPRLPDSMLLNLKNACSEEISRRERPWLKAR